MKSWKMASQTNREGMMNRQHNGIFITFEGGEGAGKSTMISLLHQKLSEMGYPVVSTREPGGSRLGEQIRDWVLAGDVKMGSRAELFLFLAGRAQHVEELVLPALHEGKIVLCDRFTDSTIAYQGFARAFGVSDVELLCKFAAMGLVPHLTLLYDVEPEIGLQRARDAVGKPSVDRIESEALLFHEEVRCGFLLQAEREPERIHLLDSNLSINEAFEATLNEALQCIQRLRGEKQKA